MVYYLKLNRMIEYSLRNLQVWIDIVSIDPNSQVYILCDNKQLNKAICEKINFRGISFQFLESIKRTEDRDLIDAIAIPKWYNAGYAHMTPFIHSMKNNIDEFWNIDADDTMICLVPERAKELLDKARGYAVENRIDLFSLDMWRSRALGGHWSFGITYTNANIDWVKLMRTHMDCQGGSRYFMNGNHPKNIDEFFSYMKSKENSVRIETFYFENLLFIHYSDDFVMHPITSGVFKYKEGKITYPIIKYIYGVQSLGEIPIFEDIIRLDISIDDIEGGFFLSRIAPFSIEAVNVFECEEFSECRIKILEKQISSNIEKWYIENQLTGKKIYIFGAGNCTGTIIKALSNKHMFVQAILDNAEHKWGAKIDNVEICAPSILKREDMESSIVMVGVRHYQAIIEQLLNMGMDGERIFKVVDYEKI